MFAVWEKFDQQRFILDARLSNCWFSESDPVSLATGTAMGAIEVDGGGPVHLGQIDLAEHVGVAQFIQGPVQTSVSQSRR
eukprot:12177497-Heterocapsa_arctica.AAC.1